MTQTINPTDEIRVFDRLMSFDERSRNYPARVAKPGTAQSVLWTCEPRLDQGREGMCVGFSIAHALACLPPPVRLLSVPDIKSVYYAAQQIDEFPGGSYEGATPYSEGTSVLAGMKVAKERGLVDAYRWTFSVEELIAGLAFGPAVLGIMWYSEMSTPTKDGFSRASGSFSGGHAICCRGVDVELQYFILRNSWGRKFGRNGDCYITFKDMERLLYNGGEACFPVKREPEVGFLTRMAMVLGLCHK